MLIQIIYLALNLAQMFPVKYTKPPENILSGRQQCICLETSRIMQMQCSWTELTNPIKWKYNASSVIVDIIVIYNQETLLDGLYLILRHIPFLNFF